MPLHHLFETPPGDATDRPSRIASKSPLASFEPALQRRELTPPPSARAPSGSARKSIREYFAQPVPALRPLPMHSKYARSVGRSAQPDKTPANVSPQIADAVRHASQMYDVPESLIHAVIRNESAYNPRAVSRVGAQGLMQLMPGTAQDLGVRNAFDVRDNINGGTKYLRQMLDQFGDVRLAVAAYNAGPGAVRKYGNAVPAYAETQQYVTRVLNSYQALRSRV